MLTNVRFRHHADLPKRPLIRSCLQRVALKILGRSTVEHRICIKPSSSVAHIIESYFGISQDGGDGSLEIMLLVPLVLICNR